MEKSILQTALQYLTKSYSVIPVKSNKKPFIQWEEFQQRHPTQDEVREWWKKWPSANIAIVTGKVSGICVIDIDEEGGFEAIQNYIPDSLIIPTSKTPKGGQHLYFKMPEQSIGNNSRILPGCDFRGEGGYIIAPPSKGYTWLNGLSLDEAEPPSMPSQYINYINKYACTYKGELDNLLDNNLEKIPRGQRDERLFHIANSILNRSMRIEEVQSLLGLIALHCCKPPFPLKEIPAKIKSVLDRIERRERNLSQEVREWVLSSNGLFFSRDIQDSLGVSRREGQKLVWWALNEMVKEGLVERAGDRNGCYRRINQEAEEMDFQNASVETVNISLPFEIDEKVEIMPGNIIVIAGEMNAGKTAFLLNIIRDNMEKFEIYYFSSEMGSSELKKRLGKFDYPPYLNQWEFTAKERSDNFGDVIVSGIGKINIIDYLELHTNFYEVSKHLAEIHKKLKGAIAIVAIQKNPGTDVGLGGFRGLEKPRLYLAMGKGKLKIVKAKNWATPNNPNGLEVNFKIIDGCKLIKAGDWHLVT